MFKKLLTPIYLGVMFCLVAGIIPLLISLHAGAGFVGVPGGRYYLLDYGVFTVMRFIVIVCGTLLLYLCSVRPKHCLPLLFGVLILSLVLFII